MMEANNGLRRILPEELKENVFRLIGREWMLVTAGTPERFNTMTASWGGLGWLWNRPVAFVFIRPERYTYGFVEDADTLTLSFLGEGHRDILTYCGRVSGRDADKIRETGLEPLSFGPGAVGFRQSRLTLVCRKLFRAPMQEAEMLDPALPARFYTLQEGGYHTMYIAEIESVWAAE